MAVANAASDFDARAYGTPTDCTLGFAILTTSTSDLPWFFSANSRADSIPNGCAVYAPESSPDGRASDHHSELLAEKPSDARALCSVVGHTITSPRSTYDSTSFAWLGAAAHVIARASTRADLAIDALALIFRTELAFTVLITTIDIDRTAYQHSECPDWAARHTTDSIAERPSYVL